MTIGKKVYDCEYGVDRSKAAKEMRLKAIALEALQEVFLYVQLYFVQLFCSTCFPFSSCFCDKLRKFCVFWLNCYGIQSYCTLFEWSSLD